MARALAVAVVALTGIGVAVPPASATPAPDHVLIALGTAGDRPYPTKDVEQVAAAAQSFIRHSSLGHETIDFSITPWIQAFRTTPACGGWSQQSFDSIVAPLRTAAATAGFAAATYNRSVYAIADQHCGFFGITWGTQVLLTREPTPDLLVHELGHTFGLGHAAAADCPLNCTVEEQGDPYSPMGTGLSDFSAYEKSVLGWIGPQPHARSTGTYTLTSPRATTSKPQALVVDTQFGQWWFEYRTQPRRGILARFVNQADIDNPVPPFAPSARLILDPTHHRRPWIAAHESYTADGTFTIRVAQTGQSSAVVRIASTTRH